MQLAQQTGDQNILAKRLSCLAMVHGARGNLIEADKNCPGLFYRTAYDLGQWYETVGQDQESAVLYAKAKAAVEHMATAIEDEDLCAIFRKSAPVQAIYDCAVRVC